jgi:hypothetical protein
MPPNLASQPMPGHYATGVILNLNGITVKHLTKIFLKTNHATVAFPEGFDYIETVEKIRPIGLRTGVLIRRRLF